MIPNHSIANSVRRRLQLWLALLVFITVFRLPAEPVNAEDSRALATVLDRFVQSVLPSEPADAARVHDIAFRYKQAMDAAGHWPDLDYQNRNRADWAGEKHLTRVLIMAKAVRLSRNAGRPDSDLSAKTLIALKAWTGPDPQNPNWWWNRIGVPELVGEIAAILKPGLPDAELTADERILSRSGMQGMTGANLTWCAINQVILGCLRDDPAVTREAYERLYREIRFANASSHGEGIQPDFSFHQHGPQLYNGGYGLFYANDVGRFIYASWGTPYEIPDDRRKLFDQFMLEGMRWMTWGDTLDYSTVGRTIVRPGLTAVPHDWSLGPISPAGPACSLGNVTRLLSRLPGDRQKEYAAWAACLSPSPAASPMTGNKQFWCSDYMVDRESGYMTSVKMFSSRTINAEMMNSEGRLSHHLSDGANWLYLDGDEYQNIFPCLDWQKIPGTTAEQVEDMAAIASQSIGVRGKTDFVGGVTDGTRGMCAMDLSRGSLRARKAWFFFQGEYVCLGVGVTIENDHPVFTTVNQSLLKGEVFDEFSPRPLSRGKHDLDGVKWVNHDRIGYVFPTGQHVVVSTADRTGRWSDIGAGPDDPVTRAIFSLWIDHGRGAPEDKYEYVVLPATTLDKARHAGYHPDIQVLSNKANLQAVFRPSEKLCELAFWTAGQINTPCGEVQVSEPCLLLVDCRSDGQPRVTAANPVNRALHLKVRVGRRSAEVDLPGGPDAGSSVSLKLYTYKAP